MRFLLDSMLPPRTADRLTQRGHEAVTPADLGGHDLPDDVLVEIAATDGWVIVTENAADFAHVVSCPVLLVRKRWWSGVLADQLAEALDRWAREHPEPGDWPHWLESRFR